MNECTHECNTRIQYLANASRLRRRVANRNPPASTVIRLAFDLHSAPRAMRRRRLARACALAVACALMVRSSRADAPRAHAFAIGGDANDTALALPKTVARVRFVEIEMKLMSASADYVLGVFPEDTSSYCEGSSVKASWRRFARAIDGAGRLRDVVVAEATHEGTDVSRIAEVKALSKPTDRHGMRARARKAGCGFIALAISNEMHMFEGDATDGDALANWLVKYVPENRFEEVEEVRSRHEVLEFVERNETVVRAILLEEVPWLKVLAKSFDGKVAYARASSLVGSRYIMGLPFHEAGVAGLLFVPKMESIEDDDHAKRVEVRLIRRQNETLNYYEIAETLIEAERELGYAAMMESTIDVVCANAVWELAANSIHPEYAQAVEGQEEQAYELMPPPSAWEFIKADLLDLLDGHGKGDKTLVPEQWLCGLAGLTAAHRDMANEYTEAAGSLEELETLQKENLALRQRNAMLEREVAQCDSSSPKAPRGSARLPKSKPAGWTFDAKQKKPPQPPKPTPPIPEDNVMEDANEDADKEDEDLLGEEGTSANPSVRDEL